MLQWPENYVTFLFMAYLFGLSPDRNNYSISEILIFLSLS